MIVIRLRDQDGATLTEQLIALLIGSALIACLYGYFRAELYHTIAVEAKTASLEDARGALDIIIRDLRNAGSWGSGSVPSEIGTGDDPSNDGDTVCNRVYAATATMIHVQMDLNGNGNCADNDPRENIRYELAGPTSTCPGPNIIRRNGDCLVANIVPTVTGKVFSYYDAKGTDLGSAPPRDAIKRVKIGFTVRVKNPDPKVTANLTSIISSSVEFRN
jgi:type II secretory pathway component PulJ